MKFLADMGISPRTVHYLRKLGHEAVHLHERQLDRLADPEILAMARREEHVLLTHDLDFGELVARSKDSLPSVVTFRLRDMRADNVNRHLGALLMQYVDVLSAGAIMTVTEGRIRVRQLPFEGERA